MEPNKKAIPRQNKAFRDKLDILLDHSNAFGNPQDRTRVPTTGPILKTYRKLLPSDEDWGRKARKSSEDMTRY